MALFFDGVCWILDIGFDFWVGGESNNDAVFPPPGTHTIRVSTMLFFVPFVSLPLSEGESSTLDDLLLLS